MLMTAEEKTALRHAFAHRNLSSRQEKIVRSQRLFMQHNPRTRNLLLEVVDGEFKVKEGFFAPAARASIQRWVDRLVARPQDSSSQRDLETGVSDWLKGLKSQLFGRS